MDITIFYDKNWVTLDASQKTHELQTLENELASFENRKARKCELTDKDEHCQNGAEAQYNFSTPEIIYLRKINSGFDSALSTIHEGIHAMYDDAFKIENTKVVSFDEIDVKKLVFERENKDIIHNHFYQKNALIIFQLCYFEERIAHLDSERFLLSLIERYLNDQKIGLSLNQEKAQKELFYFYEKIFIKEINRLNYITKVNGVFGVNYDSELKYIDFKGFDVSIENVAKPVVTTYGRDIKIHFAQQLQIYKNIQNIKMASRKDENIKKFMRNFNEFIMKS